MTRYVIILLLAMSSVLGSAQEFQCSVQVVSTNVQGSNKKVFETMQKAIMEFMNNQKWTSDVFSAEERIDCNIMINISERVAIDEFKASFQIQARRPVYGSNYYTVLLNHKDQDFQFKYVEFEPLVYNLNNLESNLVAMLAYYANIVLGLDYDSFKNNGGTSYYKVAEQIVNKAQSIPYSGWKSFEDQRNRYWLVENILNEYHKPLRQCFYEYHRRGLDRMSEKAEDGRAQIVKSLELTRKVHRQRPGSIFSRIFFTSKSDELVKIFSESFSMEKGRVVELLQEVDPGNNKKYEKILKAN